MDSASTPPSSAGSGMSYSRLLAESGHDKGDAANPPQDTGRENEVKPRAFCCRRVGCVVTVAFTLVGMFAGLSYLYLTGHIPRGAVSKPASWIVERIYNVTGSGPQTRSSDGNVEWVVTPELVNVRGYQDLNSSIIDQKEQGSVVIGRHSEDDWLHLTYEPGYMVASFKGQPVLRRRTASYSRVDQGTCEEKGLLPIVSPSACKAAASALDLSNSLLVDAAQQECGLKNDNRRQLGLLPKPGIRVVGVSSSAQICSNVSYKPADNAAAWVLNASTRTNTSTRTDSFTSTTSTTWTNTTTATSRTSTTSTSTTSDPGPRLLCFSVMRVKTDEETLMRAQLSRGLGIFACDDFIVLADQKTSLGKHRYLDGEVYTWYNPAPNVGIGDLSKDGETTNSWLNCYIFIQAMDVILTDSKKRIWKNDWLVKVDPDAVFFPDRLKNHVEKLTGAVFLLNCDHGGPKLYGALEVFSKAAMRRYEKDSERCKKEMHWKGWGEDMYFQECMKMIGVRGVVNYKLVGDDRCMKAGCSDWIRAAFHPFKDQASWFGCWTTSAGPLPPLADQSKS